MKFEFPKNTVLYIRGRSKDATYLVVTYLVATYLVVTYLVATYLVATYLVVTYLVATYLVTTYLVAAVHGVLKTSPPYFPISLDMFTEWLDLSLSCETDKSVDSVFSKLSQRFLLILLYPEKLSI